MHHYEQLTLPANHTYKQEILNPLTKLLNHYVEKHSKTMVVRFDLRFPYDFPIIHSNKYISDTIAYIIKKYKRWDLDPMYFWTMEQHNSIHPHYHVALFFDGQKVRSYSHVFHTVEETWGRALSPNIGVDINVHGCVHHCNTSQGKVDMHRNGLEIRRCDGSEIMQGQIQAVYNQLSYLAKEATKAPIKDGLRNFGMSQIPTV